MTGSSKASVTVEAVGRPVRHLRVAVSAEAMALAWAHQEDGPAGAAVVVDREITPAGRGGQPWEVPPERTLALAMILRPDLSAAEADAVWLMSSLAAAEAAETVIERPMGAWWPDTVIDMAAGNRVAATKAEVRLGPGTVRGAVVTVRYDLEALALGLDGRDVLLKATLHALDRIGVTDLEALVPSYERRSVLMGERVRVRLLPKGETRGFARAIDRRGRLELESATGMVEWISVDTVRDVVAV